MWPVLNWVVFGIGAAYCIASILGWTGYPPTDGVVPGDAWNYWLGDAYGSEHYRYSPAFLWLTAPLRALPFEVFVGIWTALHLGAIVWLGPWTILLAFDDVVRGNINVFIAVGIVAATRGHPWTWAGVLLTKVTPGVGILFHVGRGDWRAVGVALLTTASIVAIGVAVDAQLWREWIDSLRAGTQNYETINVLGPLPLRVGVGAIVCLASARWIWLLPVGMIIALPGLWPAGFAMLAAIPKLAEARVADGDKHAG